MSIYVLVHGGFYGGWGFTKVANIMRAAGHEVFTPTLTGYGERAHLASPNVGLNTNIQDIVGVLQCEDLHQVILVGHSYGSAVIFGVAEKEAERIARLVVLDGWIPKDGQTVFELMGQVLTKQWLDYAKEKGDGWRGPPLPNPPCAPPRWQPVIITGGTEPLEIKNQVAQKIPRAFIRCAIRDKNSAVASGLNRVDRYAEEAKQNGWWYRDIPDGHSVMLTNPKLLADTLLELA
jgi:pimeloyl-ACP methyl ester carboxylesterase